MKKTTTTTATTATTATTTANATAVTVLADAIRKAQAKGAVMLNNPNNDEPMTIASAIDAYNNAIRLDALEVAKNALIAKAKDYADFVKFCGDTVHTYSYINFDNVEVFGEFRCNVTDIFTETDYNAWKKVCNDIMRYRIIGHKVNAKGKKVPVYQSLCQLVVLEADALENAPNVERIYRNELEKELNRLFGIIRKGKTFSKNGVYQVAVNAVKGTKNGDIATANVGRVVQGKIWDYLCNGRKNEKAFTDSLNKAKAEKAKAEAEK